MFDPLFCFSQSMAACEFDQSNDMVSEASYNIFKVELHLIQVPFACVFFSAVSVLFRQVLEKMRITTTLSDTVRAGPVVNR